MTATFLHDAPLRPYKIVKDHRTFTQYDRYAEAQLPNCLVRCQITPDIYIRDGKVTLCFSNLEIDGIVQNEKLMNIIDFRSSDIKSINVLQNKLQIPIELVDNQKFQQLEIYKIKATIQYLNEEYYSGDVSLFCKPHGKGFLQKNGETFEGEFYNGDKNGVFFYKNTDQDIEGTILYQMNQLIQFESFILQKIHFKRSAKHNNHFIVIDNTGSLFIGEFQPFDNQGDGEVTSSSKDQVFQGKVQLVDQVFSFQQGTLEHSGQKFSFTGSFVNNEPLSGTVLFRDHFPWIQYDGVLDLIDFQNKSFSGIGMLSAYNSQQEKCQWIGKFWNGKLMGTGKMKCQNGDIISGKFMHSQLQGSGYQTNSLSNVIWEANFDIDGKRTHNISKIFEGGAMQFLKGSHAKGYYVAETKYDKGEVQIAKVDIDGITLDGTLLSNNRLFSLKQNSKLDGELTYLRNVYNPNKMPSSESSVSRNGSPIKSHRPQTRVHDQPQVLSRKWL